LHYTAHPHWGAQAVDNRETMVAMLQHATRRDGLNGECCGIARMLTDFSYVDTSDLAV
jgi:hypothetical protein